MMMIHLSQICLYWKTWAETGSV